MKKTVSLSASLLAAAVCGGAYATTVDLQYTGMGANEIVNITTPGYSGLAYVGAIMITASSSSNTAVFANGNYQMYCADLYQDSSTNVNPYLVTVVPAIPTSSPMGPVKAAMIASMYAAAAGAQYGGNAALNCGFQLAIWEIVTDVGGPLGLNSGAFQATGESAAADAYFNAFMAAALGGQGSAALIGLASPDYQDYITEQQGDVPAPGALALVGLSGLISSRRRRA